MKANYNSWFHEYNKYLTATRGDKKDFIDTKWVDINHRMNTLRNLKTDLIKEQPFGIVGNNKGFSHLIDLISKSDYTFEDIDHALVKSYKRTLQASMSNMLVNTQALMFHCTSSNNQYVSYDTVSGYYVIDVPFNQLHFGDRDEFIRNKLHEMYKTSKDNYMTMNKFISSEISSMLGFSLLCSVNGYICNDWMVAIDDRGFKFKIMWIYTSSSNKDNSLDFGIYKLDTIRVHHVTVPTEKIQLKSKLTLKDLGIVDNYDSNENKCIIDIYSPSHIRTGRVVPNFSTISSKGLEIHKIQQHTINEIKSYSVDNVNIIIYELKYLHEVPNIYPATNYYNVLDNRKVYSENTSSIVDIDKLNIVTQSTNIPTRTPICTPPIVIDRKIGNTFFQISSCVNLDKTLNSPFYEDTLLIIGNILEKDDEYVKLHYKELIMNVNAVLPYLESAYKNYVYGAILTSLVPSSLIQKFKNVIDNMKDLSNNTDPADVLKYDMDIYHKGRGSVSNYKQFVLDITKPFDAETLSVFKDIERLNTQYFAYDSPTRFTRPIAEQCFITMKYDKTTEAWLFAWPNIEHFKGIGNSFYIKDNLSGKEIFKFFILYTDTEAPSELNVDQLKLMDVYDFDKFCVEVENHMGYIKYWNAENKLMKLSKILYGKYNDETVVQVLSKILLEEISADDIINQYESEIKYDESGKTTSNWENYTLDSLEAPFTINYLFYTLSMIHDNEDKMEAYFMRTLTDKKYHPRYTDININEIIDKNNESPINYSRYSIAPDIIQSASSSIPLGKSLYYGLPYVVEGNIVKTETPYRYSFNIYDNFIRHPIVLHDELNPDGYLSWTTIDRYNSDSVDYSNDIKVAKLVTKYLTYAYTCVSEIQTNYTKSYDIRYLINEFMENYNKIVEELNEFDNSKFENDSSQTIIDKIRTDNVFVTHLELISNKLTSVNTIRHDSRNKSFRVVLDILIDLIKEVFDMSGFCNSSLRRIKKLYNHLKKYNSKMNIHELLSWWNQMDFNMIRKLSTSISSNENCKVTPTSFNEMYTTIVQYYIGTIVIIRDLSEIFEDDIVEYLWNDHFNICAEYCRNVYTNNIFDLFAIKNVEIINEESYDARPYYIQIKTNDSMKHFKSPKDTIQKSYNLVFKTETIMDDYNKWVINDVIPICEYTMFDGSDITNVTGDIFDKDGNHISTVAVNMYFMKVGSSSGNNNTINVIPNTSLTSISFRNEHEKINVVDDNIISSAYADMNFELLFGNKYIQLDHTHEYVLDPTTYEEHAVEVVHIPNRILNTILMQDNSNMTNVRMFFKPSQILHQKILDGTYLEKVIESVYGKCFVGQRIYLSTDDGLSIFPATVTVIDHSQSRGFIEAEVDSYHSQWFETKDSSVISKYLFNTVKCHVIPDNMMNFVKEYNNSEYLSYNIPNNDHNNDKSPESLPGEPLFVTNNANYVYTRLNYMFHDKIPNRFVDDDKKSHEFIFLGNFVPTYNENGEVVPINVNLINVNTNELSTPEIYPILREEPNDHTIWDLERETFKKMSIKFDEDTEKCTDELDKTLELLLESKTKQEQDALFRELNAITRRLQFIQSESERINHYGEQLESPTTWYNIRSYDAALIYIDNGRSYESPSIIIDKRDIPISDKISIFLYDWENKVWMDPSTYDITLTQPDNIESIDVKADYYTSNIIKEITITPNENWNMTSNIIVYISYNKSDIYDDIPLNKNECQVRFKPILSTSNNLSSIDPYSVINIRKHYDGYEEYTFDRFNAVEHNFVGDGIFVKRYHRNGKYLEVPVMRMCDLSLTNNNKTYSSDELKLYVHMPFKDITTKVLYATPIYETEVNVDIDDFVENETIKLVCVSNNNNNFFNGMISSTMFEGLTSIVDGVQTITITNSTLEDFVTGSFVCSVFQSNNYKSHGGLITISIRSNTENILTSNGAWVRIPEKESYYKSLPDEFVILPKDNESIDITKPITVILKNEYKQTIEDEIVIDNKDINPYEFYFDQNKNVRYPISDVRTNNQSNRLIIDTDKNTDIKIAKMTYIGIPRYSLLNIPQDGIIDVTGYIPTPLSRTRYEWWVNGRQILPDNIIILSPTSFQLINLRSLKNFELIELVDDVNTSELMKKGNVYLDADGKTYGSYRLALLSGKTMVDQNIRFLFNTSNHTPMHDYTRTISNRPNNIDIESNILTDIEKDTEDVTSYTEIQNIPSINGVSLYNTKTHDIGIKEIPITDIIDILDDVWKEELITNPLFPISHHQLLETESNIVLHKSNPNIIGYTNDDMVTVYASGISDKFFTLYISSDVNGDIDDTSSTLKIIPFFKVGTYILIEKKYEGMWLHSTEPDVKSIKL